jgi:RNA polymerase sigma-70 factor (family 1)
MTMIQDIEKILVERLKEGDVLAFDQIYKRYNRKVYYFAFSYLKDRAESEDIVQEVFMNLWKFREQINEYYTFSRYIFKITYNSTCKRFRKQVSDRRHIEEVLKHLDIEDDSTKVDIEFNNLVEVTNQLINKLPERQKSIFIFSIEENLSTSQIAEKLNISKKSVDNYLAMAKRTLRKSMFDEGILAFLFICLFII